MSRKISKRWRVRCHHIKSCRVGDNQQCLSESLLGVTLLNIFSLINATQNEDDLHICYSWNKHTSCMLHRKKTAQRADKMKFNNSIMKWLTRSFQGWVNITITETTGRVQTKWQLQETVKEGRCNPKSTSSSSRPQPSAQKSKCRQTLSFFSFLGQHKDPWVYHLPSEKQHNAFATSLQLLFMVAFSEALILLPVTHIQRW